MDQSFDVSEWVGEVHEDYAFFYRGGNVFFSKSSPFQKVEVVETRRLGRALLNDGFFMVSEKDEAHYHEMMVHVPMHIVPDAKRVLVIGGGDGGTAREVLRYPSVESVVMVEIDSLVIEASKLHLPQTAIAFDNPRLELIVGDGVEYLRKAQSASFDLILIDSTDPIGAAAPLFGEEFYRDVHRCLDPNGVVIAQGESPYHNQEMQLKLIETVSSFFAIRSYYNFSNMTYPGGLWSFLYASNSHSPLQLKAQAPEIDSQPMQYYSEAVHRAAFALPEFQRKALAQWIHLG